MNAEMLEWIMAETEKAAVVGSFCLLFAGLMSVLEFCSTFRMSLLVQAALLGVMGTCSLEAEMSIDHRVRAWTQDNLNILNKVPGRGLIYCLAGVWWLSARSVFELEATSSWWLYAILDRVAAVGLTVASGACFCIWWRNRRIGGDAAVPLTGAAAQREMGSNGYYISS
mmetsp:Transcript_32839/g.70420  ORF Transcript_32839/g.70420 Transcript_32839/m.70420 type:complete len:169 (-) Transcript_32839:384-890(-)